MLFHITELTTWQEAQGQGVYQAKSLASEGFIHLSQADQVVATGNRFYKGQLGLVLLGIDEARLESELRYEKVSDHGTFPHLYGPLNIEAVVQVRDFIPQADGTFAMPG
ncbi:MAG: DUF952 domain-containing protein [Leptolyngbyaceae cyanobacterium MAG.088]|nr:DUF952 domain-containing protein [Leptolyngbyaceae cyanobacterium MAG.088]